MPDRLILASSSSTRAALLRAAGLTFETEPSKVEEARIKRLARATGDSAGACPALGAAMAMRDAGETAVRFQLLVYGCYSTDTESPSWQRFGRGAGLSQTQMRWIWETYLERPEQQSDWRAPMSPARSHTNTREPRRVI